MDFRSGGARRSFENDLQQIPDISQLNDRRQPAERCWLSRTGSNGGHGISASRIQNVLQMEKPRKHAGM